MKKLLQQGKLLFLSLSFSVFNQANAQQLCNGSLLFDQTNDISVSLPATNQYYSATNGGYTWECWFKLNSPLGGSTANDRQLISAIDWTTYEDMYLGFGWHGGVQNRGYDSLVFKVDPPGAATPVDINCAWAPSGGFNVGQWYHVHGVADYNNKVKYLYVDCELVDMQPLTVAPNTRVIPANLSAWSSGNGSNSLDGYMDEVRIWDRPLTQDEIQRDCNRCLWGNEPNLFLYYRCNQNGATSVIDATANLNTGSFVNPPMSGWASDNAPVDGDACRETCKCLGSLDFNATTNPAVELPLSNQYYSGANDGYTWECWFKLRSDPADATVARPLISAIDWTTFEDMYLGFGWDGGWYDVTFDSLVFKVDGPSSTAPSFYSCAWKPSGGFVVGQWYHAAGVMDYLNGFAHLYVDGVLRDSRAIPYAPNTRVIQTNLSSWSSGGGAASIDGLMDEVRIWDRPLSATEIATNYDKCRAGTESNLLIYYRCNQVGASNVFDGAAPAGNGVFSSAPGPGTPGWSTENAPVIGSCQKDCNKDDYPHYPDPKNPDGKTTGLAKQSNVETGLMIYPNPSSGSIKVSSKQAGMLTLYSVTGQVLSEIKVVENEREVRLDGYKPGIYLYVFNNGTATSSGKLIIE